MAIPLYRQTIQIFDLQIESSEITVEKMHTIDVF